MYFMDPQSLGVTARLFACIRFVFEKAAHDWRTFEI